VSIQFTTPSDLLLLRAVFPEGLKAADAAPDYEPRSAGIAQHMFLNGSES